MVGSSKQKKKSSAVDYGRADYKKNKNIKRGFFNLWKQKAIGREVHNGVGMARAFSHAATQTARFNRKKRGYGDAGYGYMRPKYKKAVKVFKGMSNFNKNGVVLKVRKTTKHNDDTGIYNMVPTIDMGYMLRAVACCLIKNLCEKAGMRVSALDQPLFTYNAVIDPVSSNTNYAFQIVFRNVDSVTPTNNTHNVVAGDNVMTVAEWLIPFLRDWSSGSDNSAGAGTNENNTEPIKLKLVHFQTTTIWLSSELYLDEVMLDVYGSCKIVMQNRSLAQDTNASGGDDHENAMNVANHPVRGIIYKFKGIPRYKNNWISTSGGVISTLERIPIDDATVNNAVALSETDPDVGVDLLEPKVFNNVTGSSAFKQDPGAVRRYNDSFSKRISLRMLMKTMRFQYGATSGGFHYSSYSVFPTIMFGITNVINTRESLVALAFEYDKIIAVKMHTKKKKYCVDYKFTDAQP